MAAVEGNKIPEQEGEETHAAGTEQEVTDPSKVYTVCSQSKKGQLTHHPSDIFCAVSLGNC